MAILSKGYDKAIGIIGMGDMGKMYAKTLSDAGWT
jgi:3-hydroxyisobutyrate dehydrogenase-like beta-hydroxyacid dehydrogenase